MAFVRGRKVLDEFAQLVFQDGQPHVVGTDAEVEYKFKPRNACCTSARRLLAVAAVALMIFWLVWDVNKKELNGMVSGISETYVITSQPAAGQDELMTTCICTYNNSALLGAPVGRLELVLGISEGAVLADVFLPFCGGSKSLAAMTTMANVSDEVRAMVQAAPSSYCEIIMRRGLRHPSTASNLSRAAWRVARLSDVAGASFPYGLSN